MWLLGNKVLVKDSGLLEGCCDYHSHLLPGVDDGVERMAETLKILDLWEEAGMQEVWLTPHMMEEVPNTPVELRNGFEELTNRYTGSIRLHLAAEHMLDGLFKQRLADGRVMTIGKEQKRLLVETSYYNPPMNMVALIEAVKEKGLIPVLAHPERYRYMAGEDYAKWKAGGVLLQLNMPSLVGMYGPEVQRKAEELLKKGMYDCVGTDTHSLGFAEDFMEGMMKKQTVRAVRDIFLGHE